ncbi:hypothetical protein GGR54DRAFT_612759 [Hypoxylon sp. NC1633]|nr:hypothetical protein GGR54DRAFT_612759 [Hypoxylon sp. NC1633]
MKTYTPGQIRIILAQREQALGVAQKLALLKEPPPGFRNLSSTKPWVPSEAYECQFKCCQRCRPSAEARSYLSLDGIAKDDIPPTAAIGFGFHRAGTRPVIHPDRLENIGLRAVPLPRACSYTDDSSQSSLASLESSSNSGEQLPKKTQMGVSELPSLSDSMESVNSDELGQSTHSDMTQPPWPSTVEFPKKQTKSILLAAAALTPLPSPSTGEQTRLRRCTSRMMKLEMEEGRFHKEPLEVDHGVAVSEESIDLGLPDVITQA